MDNQTHTPGPRKLADLEAFPKRSDNGRVFAIKTARRFTRGIFCDLKLADQYEVIGNIHNNPELLEAK